MHIFKHNIRITVYILWLKDLNEIKEWKLCVFFRAILSAGTSAFHNLHNWKRDLFQIGMYWIIYSSLILTNSCRFHYVIILVYIYTMAVWSVDTKNTILILLTFFMTYLGMKLCFLSCLSQQQKLENITLVNRSISRNKKHVGRYWFVLIFTNLYLFMKFILGSISSRLGLHHDNGYLSGASSINQSTSNPIWNWYEMHVKSTTGYSMELTPGVWYKLLMHFYSLEIILFQSYKIEYSYF